MHQILWTLFGTWIGWLPVEVLLSKRGTAYCKTLITTDCRLNIITRVSNMTKELQTEETILDVSSLLRRFLYCVWTNAYYTMKCLYSCRWYLIYIMVDKKHYFLRNYPLFYGKGRMMNHSVGWTSIWFPMKKMR